MTPDQLSQAIAAALATAVADGTFALDPADVPATVHVERPRQREHGDWATNVALQLAKKSGTNPRASAEELARRLSSTDGVASVEVAGPGFLNIRLKTAAKQQVVREVLEAGAAFGRQSAPAEGAERVLVEFVSANPTGPLHVGHGRQAALGDAICNLLETQGKEVFREFYYNDAGVQIQTLANSTQLRAKGLKPGDPGCPEQAYNGEYIADIARDFLAIAQAAARRG